MNPAYKEFIEKSEGIVFTAVQEGTKLVHLEEEPRWLFWCGDLNVVEAVAKDPQVSAEKEGE